MYQQRAPREITAENQAEQDFWRPPSLSPEMAAAAQLAPPAISTPAEGDKYVVVDDLMYGRVALAVCPWPRVNQVGDLTFEPSEEVIVPEDIMQEYVTMSREGQAAPDRPIRISDAFLVREMPDAPPAFAEVVEGIGEDEIERQRAIWRDYFGQWVIVDVTADAREAAKVALYSAVAPALSAEEADRFEMDDDQPSAGPPPGPQAQPTV